MSFEIPKTRSEKILQNILGAKNKIEPIQSRIEAILFAILNDTEIGDPYTAPARCEIEKLLVAIKDGGEYNETPLTRSGRILLCKLRGEEYSGTTQSRLEKLFLRWLYELMEITDVPPFTFKSKGNNLIDYDIYGAEDGIGNNEDKAVSGNPISVSDAIEAPADSLQVTFTPTQDGTPSIDSEPTTEPYLSKVVPRGNKEYYSLVGGTVAWNQLFNYQSVTSETIDGITFTNNNDGTITVNGTANADVYKPVNVPFRSIPDPERYPSWHKYYIFGCPSGGSANSYNMHVRWLHNLKYDTGSGTIWSYSNPGNASGGLQIFVKSGTVIETPIVFKPQCIDLTLMFANEPAIANRVYTLEQSEAGSGIAWLKSYGFFTKDYYPYNEGELISVNASGHKIGNTTYPIDPTDLRGLFKLSNGKLYCKGDVYPPSGDASRKYGIVDLGTLNWQKGTYTFYATVTGMRTTNATILCSKYVSGQYGTTGAEMSDMTICPQINAQIFIKDSTKSEMSGTDFKTAMSGQYLVYELATSTTETATPYASPIDMEAGGTEEFIDNRTVPIPVGNETYYASEYAVHGKTGVTVSHGATEDDPNPTEYEVEFTSQGTVYGGTVDIVSGVLSVNYGHVNLGSLSWGRYKFGEVWAFYHYIDDMKKNSALAMCSRFSYSGNMGPGRLNNMAFTTDNNTHNGYVYIRDDLYTDANTFTEAVNGTILAYELAEPQTYQLTPQQVQMLLNDNYLTTEDGTITLTYKNHNIEVPFSVSCGGESNSYRVDLSDKLYKVGAYADSISYDDQTVKREIIVERLDGTEEWVLNDGVFSTTLSTVARTPAVLCNELTSEQCYLSEDLTTLNVTGVPQTSVEEFTSWLQANDIYVQYVRENTLVTSHMVPAVSTFNGTNTFSVDTDVTPSEVTIIYPNRVTTRALPKTKKIGKSKLTKSK